MGSLNVPPSGMVYVDANPVIYSVEKLPVYGPLLQPLWQAAKAKTVEIVSSELVVLETLVGPLKAADTVLADAYEQLFQQPQTRLFRITRTILRGAARLRATTKLKTPDAIHAAAAVNAGCLLFVTNDTDFRGALRIPVIILDDLLAS